jgi:hypothetical protein
LRDQSGHAIISSLLDRATFDRELAHKFLDFALDRDADWSARRVAVLALENQLLRLDSAKPDEFLPFLARLGFLPESGAPGDPDLLKQGYTTTEPRAFVVELSRRLSRLAPLHEALWRADARADAIGDFEHVASRECLLTLARGVFSPDEVVARVVRHVWVAAAESEFSKDPGKVSASSLPSYEAAILGLLLAMNRSWWVCPATPSSLNALIENPLGTLALAIRPPGSTIEFEIKRVGLRGRHPLTVEFERGGEELPPSHRLQGGTTLPLLRWESTSSERLSIFFRKIHDEAAPISAFAQISSVKTVPRSDGGEIRLATWFEDSASFGDGFAPMRHAMARSLHAFVEEDEIKTVPQLPEARTRAFLACMPPGQGVIVGTSALRLDKIRAWLSSGGPESYFKIAHGRAPTLSETYRFADTILMEILGAYRPPARAGCYAGYVAAAFAEPENRAAADRGFRAVVATMGRLWGTLLGLRAFTRGESFVPRNVGLRAAWVEGAWRTQIVFMDHELTSIPGKHVRYFHPWGALPGMQQDLVHILGGQLGSRLLPGTLAVLADIYRVDRALAVEGRAILVEQVRRAYRVTLRQMRNDGYLRSQFTDAFLDGLPAWDAIVAIYRASRVGALQRSRWKGQMRQVMSSYGLNERLIRQSRRAIYRQRHMLRRYPFLFEGGDV